MVVDIQMLRIQSVYIGMYLQYMRRDVAKVVNLLELLTLLNTLRLSGLSSTVYILEAVYNCMR